MLSEIPKSITIIASQHCRHEGSKPKPNNRTPEH